jgi:hypothetical protein
MSFFKVVVLFFLTFGLSSAEDCPKADPQIDFNLTAVSYPCSDDHLHLFSFSMLVFGMKSIGTISMKKVINVQMKHCSQILMEPTPYGFKISPNQPVITVDMVQQKLEYHQNQLVL